MQGIANGGEVLASGGATGELREGEEVPMSWRQRVRWLWKRVILAMICTAIIYFAAAVLFFAVVGALHHYGIWGATMSEFESVFQRIADKAWRAHEALLPPPLAERRAAVRRPRLSHCKYGHSRKDAYASGNCRTCGLAHAKAQTERRRQARENEHE